MQDSRETLSGPLPDWNQIFLIASDLDPPGYREAFEHVRSRLPNFEQNRFQAKMKQINKEKVRDRNRNRAKNGRA